MQRRNFIAAIALLPGTALAHAFKLGRISIGHAWALPSYASDGQVFFPLVNGGAAPDALVAARSGICSLIELRSNNRYDDPPLTAIELDPNIPIPMRPTARHLRLLGLAKPLAIGDRFPLIVDFRDAGEIEIEVVVEEVPGAG